MGSLCNEAQLLGLRSGQRRNTLKLNVRLPKELEVQSLSNVTQLQQKKLTSLFSRQLIKLVCDLSGNAIAEVGMNYCLLLQ